MKILDKIQLEFFRFALKKSVHLASRIEEMSAQAQGKNVYDPKFLLEINKNLIAKSKSQLRQDLFVLSELGFKRNGFFVEFGATNGVDLSNSYLLEKEYGWSGILAEPAKIWHDELFQNRTSIIDTRCVWSQTGAHLLFSQTEVPELSTLNSFAYNDTHAQQRKNSLNYKVETVSLLDMLNQHNAPMEVDYLSIDTEGSEFEILENFDFEKYVFNIITCEHNFTPSRDRIRKLLELNGYRRKYVNISQFDDWYVRV